MSFFKSEENNAIPLSPSFITYNSLEDEKYRHRIKKEFQEMTTEFHFFKDQIGVLNKELEIIGNPDKQNKDKLTQWIKKYKELQDDHNDVLHYEEFNIPKSQSCLIL